MRILQVNKFHYLRGGAEKYFLDITKALEAAGHEVAVFSMKHPKNLATIWDKLFVSRLSFNEAKFRDKFLAPGRILYSLEAKRKFKKLVKIFRPDIIHIHNIYHQLSPSILSVARKRKIPVVMHLHDYKLICPNYQLFVDNEICYRCRGQKYCQAVKHKCFRRSWLDSVLVYLEMTLHHKLLKIYEKSISAYIAPSRFMKETCVSFGVPGEKIEVLYNFIDKLGEKTKFENEGYLLYFGRISKEKGIHILIEAIKETKGRELLKIAGDGPELENLKILVNNLGLEKQVEFLGKKSQEELKDIILKAKAVVIPSVWLENMPFVLLETLALGKVVIASRVGGLPELVEEGKNGFLFENKNVKELAEKIDQLGNYDLQAMGENSRRKVSHLTLENHLAKLLLIYEKYLKS